MFMSLMARRALRRGLRGMNSNKKPQPPEDVFFGWLLLVFLLILIGGGLWLMLSVICGSFIGGAVVTVCVIGLVLLMKHIA